MAPLLTHILIYAFPEYMNQLKKTCTNSFYLLVYFVLVVFIVIIVIFAIDMSEWTRE